MKGIYVLQVSISKNLKIRVGSIGVQTFQKGTYVYVGSAQNNLKKRVERHLRKRKPKFWHIDYLLGNNNVKVVRAFYNEAGKTDECRIARELNERATPIIRFGSSDCKCTSHLFRIEAPSHLNEFICENRLTPLEE